MVAGRSQGVLPDQSGGGVYHAIYGTIVQSVVAAVIAVPLGIMAAVYLVEYGRGRFAKVTTFMVDILAGVPSIVAALFIFALWIATLGFAAERVRGVAGPGAADAAGGGAQHRGDAEAGSGRTARGSYALGIPKWKTIARSSSRPRCPA